MSSRRDALERHYEREEEQLWKDYRAGRITDMEHSQAMRALQREAQQEAREAMAEDMMDIEHDWGWR